MELKRLPLRALWLWETYAFLVFAVSLALVYFFLVPFTWLWYLLVILLSGSYLVVFLLYFPFYYASARYQIDDETVRFEIGVLFRRSKVLFRKNLITVEVVQTPLAWLFRLSSLRCNGAGGVVTLVNLSLRDAVSLRNNLISRERTRPNNEMAVRNETNASH